MGVFRFKRFSICDDGATMKVGTDAVLLGSWADVANATRILDVGTGSGILALMMAQRSQVTSKIDAVELLETDLRQAKVNIANSPWPDKISVWSTPIQEFRSQKKYDLIICNPPFFSQSLLPPTESRSTARHATTLTFDELIIVTAQLLSLSGKLSIILPTIESESFIQHAKSNKIYLTRLTRFFTRRGKAQERSLLELGFNASTLDETTLVLYDSENKWSEAYRDLTKEFYIGQ